MSTRTLYTAKDWADYFDTLLQFPSLIFRKYKAWFILRHLQAVPNSASPALTDTCTMCSWDIIFCACVWSRGWHVACYKPTSTNHIKCKHFGKHRAENLWFTETQSSQIGFQKIGCQLSKYQYQTRKISCDDRLMKDWRKSPIYTQNRQSISKIANRHTKSPNDT